MLSHEIGLIVSGVVCCIIILILDALVIYQRKHPVIKSIVPSLTIIESIAFLLLIAFDTQQTVEDSTVCFVYLWLGFVSYILLELVYIAECWIWVTIYAISEHHIFLVNGFIAPKGKTNSLIPFRGRKDSGSSESIKKNIDDSTPKTLTARQKFQEWLYEHKQYATNKFIAKMFVLLFFVGIIIILVLNLSISRYRNNIIGYCEDRTQIETIVMVFMMLIGIFPFISTLIFFWKKSDVYSVKRKMCGKAIGWLVMIVFFIVTPLISKWAFKYTSIWGLLIPFLFGVTPAIVISFQNNFHDKNLRRGTISQEKMTVKDILTYRSVKTNKKLGLDNVLQFVHETYGKSGDDEYPEIAHKIFCLADMYALRTDNADAVVLQFPILWLKYFRTSGDDWSYSSTYTNQTSQFPIELNKQIKDELVIILSKLHDNGWELTEDTGEKLKALVKSIMDDLEKHINEILEERKFDKSDYFKVFLSKYNEDQAANVEFV